MGELQIGFGAISEDSAQDDSWIPNTETVIECTECGDKLYYKDFTTQNSAFSCQCTNVRVGSYPAWCASFDNFMTLTYTKEPKIYEIPYEEYCKIKKKRNQNDTA